jgi:hypothetical protein
MIRSALVLLVINLPLILPLRSSAQIKWHMITLLSGKVEFKVPDLLQTESDEKWNLHYPGRPKVPVALADDSDDIHIIVEPSRQPATEDQMAAYGLFQFQELTKYHPQARHSEHPHGTLMVNGKKIAYLKFVANVGGQDLYNYYFFASVDGYICNFVFNCPVSKQKAWDPIAEQIVHSLVIK